MGFEGIGGGRFAPFMPDPDLAHAKSKMQELHDEAAARVECLASEIDARHARIKELNACQELAVKSLRDAQVEVRSFKRALHRLVPGGGFINL